MSPEELISNLKNLTAEISARKGEVTEDDLAQYLETVTQSLNQVFTLAQDEIDRGLEQIEMAKTHLTDEGLHADAALVEPILDSVLSAQNQLKIGEKATMQKAELEGRLNTPVPHALLTKSVLKKFEAIKQFLKL